MFDFAFAVAIPLILAMLGTHYYFADKIRKKIKDEQDNYCKTMAKAQVNSLRNFMEKMSSPKLPATPPYNKLEEYYTNLFKKQFEGLDKIAEALRLESWLSNTMFLFFVAITLFLATGVFPYISIMEYSLSGFSVPSMISGVIAVIIASFRIYQIGKRV